MAGRSQRFRRIIRVGLPLALGATAVGLYASIRLVEGYLASPYPMTPSPRFDAGLIDSPVWAARPGLLAGVEVPVEFPFRRGETLAQVMSDLGLEPADAHALILELARHVDVRRLRPDDRYAALIDEDSRFRGFRVTLSGRGRVEVRRDGDDWRGEWRDFVHSSQTRAIQGVLEGPLETSIVRAGGEAVVAYVMADVLQWDLDFNRDLRLGDRFQVLYEKVFIDGEFHRVGDILALIYDNQDRRLEAYRFGEDRSHYDGDGRPLRKLFLRSPLRYSRVTSGFSSRRFHPVLKRYRPHYGVDYGAPVGTPVRVTGSGVVKFAGWDGGGGRTVKVRHPNGYTTAYLHLSRFAKGIRSGVRVGQGEVIGYVGSTGLSTAPHLDYRMQKNGRWINPLALKSKPAEPIPADRLPEFLALRDRLRESLEGALPIEGPPADTGRQTATIGPEDLQPGEPVGR